MGVRRSVTKEMKGRYLRGSRGERSAILDELCALTGWHRDHARKALRSAPGPGGGTATPEGPRSGGHLRRVRAGAAAGVLGHLDGPTGKRLAPALLELVAALRRHGELNISDQTAGSLLAMSAATIDRRLAPDRAALQFSGKGMSHTKPGSLLKSQIPMRTWADWDENTPGFVEIDLVGHEGGDNNGDFASPLTVTDIATGWTEVRTVVNKAARQVFCALLEIQAALPFPLLGIDSDNGSEFINFHLLNWCTDQQITFTRSRPANSNDGCHVEQKNWDIARHTVGYWRYGTTAEVTVLNRIWPALSPLTNLYTPQQKLLTKTRTGAKVTKRYDTAQTPYQRLLGHPDALDHVDADRLAALLETTNPAQARRDVTRLCATLLERVKRKNITTKAKANRVFLSKTKINKPPTKRASSDESTTPATRAS